MSFTLDLELRRTERALERVLSLVGRRGYELVAVQANSSHDRRSMSVELTLESQRYGELLIHQLAKLYEVKKVEMVRRLATPDLETVRGNSLAVKRPA